MNFVHLHLNGCCAIEVVADLLLDLLDGILLFLLGMFLLSLFLLLSCSVVQDKLVAALLDPSDQQLSEKEIAEIRKLIK